MQTSSNAIKSFKKKTQSLVFFLFFITFHLNGHDGHFLPFNRLRLMFEQLRERKRRNLKGVRPKREKTTRKSLRQEVLTHVILKRSFLKETVDVIKWERRNYWFCWWCTSRRFGEMSWICNCVQPHLKGNEFGNRRRSTNNWNNYKHETWWMNWVQVAPFVAWLMVWRILLCCRNPLCYWNRFYIIAARFMMRSFQTIPTSEQTRKFLNANLFYLQQSIERLTEKENHLRSNRN